LFPKIHVSEELAVAIFRLQEQDRYRCGAGMEERQTGPGAANKPIVDAESQKGQHFLYQHIHFPEHLMLLLRSEGAGNTKTLVS
jgi:hypothetical protein